MSDEERPAGVRQKDPAAVALGRRGGKKGGPIRAMRLTAMQRSDIARKAAQARWHAGEQDPAAGEVTDG